MSCPEEVIPSNTVDKGILVEVDSESSMVEAAEVGFSTSGDDDLPVNIDPEGISENVSEEMAWADG